MSNPTAAIIIIGNEILSGRTQDANIQFLCKQLALIGIVVQEARVIPDVENVIISNVRTLAKQYTMVFTTGGIGATHDDITAACIAKAFKRDLVEDPQALSLLQDYYQERMNTARRRLAYIPEGASLIRNPVSVAPGFHIENVYCLAGIPSVMQAMFGEVAATLAKGKRIYQKTITCAITENTIADELANVQKSNPDVEIGSYPFFHPNGIFGVSLVVRGSSEDRLNLVANQISELVRFHGVTPRFE